MDRLLGGAGGTLDIFNYDANGALADAGAGDGSAQVRNSAAVLVGTFPASNIDTGQYRIALPASLTALDVYDVVWTMPDTTTRETRFELVGSFAFTIASLRAFDAELADAVAYPAQAIRDVREQVEDRFAQAAKLSFTRRGRRETLDGTGREFLYVSEHRVNGVASAAIDDEAVDLANVVAYSRGKIVLSTGVWTWGLRNVDILYEHGYDTTPAPISDAARRYARYLIVEGVNKNDERITGISTDVGFQRFSLADKDHPTGIPDVDAVLADYGRRSVGAIA